MNARTSGYDSVLRLSQYIGERKPDAHVKGFSGLSFMASI